MSDYITKASQSIAASIDFFLKRINEISENGPHRKARRIPTTFPMLKLGNEEFYEYAYFERTLEWFVRDLLINTILRDLLTIHGIESMWPDNKNYVRYSTEAIEDIFPFEFIFSNNGQKIGVRYTSPQIGIQLFAIVLSNLSRLKVTTLLLLIIIKLDSYSQDHH